jgi:transposase
MNKPEHSPTKKGGGYPKEYREEAVRYWLSSGRKASEVAPELGVSDWSLNRWRKEMEKADTSTISTVPSSELNALELAKENGRLRRENEMLSRQRDILKKAISICSTDNPPRGLR